MKLRSTVFLVNGCEKYAFDTTPRFAFSSIILARELAKQAI